MDHVPASRPIQSMLTPKALVCAPLSRGWTLTCRRPLTCIRYGTAMSTDKQASSHPRRRYGGFTFSPWLRSTENLSPIEYVAQQRTEDSRIVQHQACKNKYSNISPVLTTRTNYCPSTYRLYREHAFEFVQLGPP